MINKTCSFSQNTTAMSAVTVTPSVKRYTCPYCPYGTDRRDLYTRHENIHREEKPFHCYVCYKPFNRADHVKKHFLRMHREHGYELSKIRRLTGSNSTKPLQQESGTANAGNANTQNGQQQQQHANYTSGFNNNKNYQLQPNPGNNAASNTAGIYQGTAMPAQELCNQTQRTALRDEGCRMVAATARAILKVALKVIRNEGEDYAVGAKLYVSREVSNFESFVDEGFYCSNGRQKIV